ncbi:hypothetical protein [Lacinutrix salivirga]
MKILSSVVVLGVSLCAGLCCREPNDDYPETLRIENNTIISIEDNLTTFSLNETVVIETSIDIEQTTVNNAPIILLDYDYGEINQSHYSTSLSLYKVTDFGTTVKIPLLIENIEVIEGDVILNNDNGTQDITILSQFNGTEYRSKIGFKLLETGSYFIGASYNYSNTGYCYLNGGDYNISYIEIKSKIIGSNDDGNYQFIVN